MTNKLIVSVAFVALCACGTLGKRIVMPWMCLERCEEDVEHSMEQLISIGPSAIPWVSFEAFDFDYRGTVVDIGLSHVGPRLKEAGFTVHPMLTTSNIYKVRDIWRYTEKTVNAIVQIALDNRDWIDGFNVDVEPQFREEPVRDDVVKFANFVNVLAKSLHAIGVNLTVCIADWSVFFDGSLLILSEVDKFIHMSTYTVKLERFEQIVTSALKIYGSDRLAVGLQQMDNFSASDLQKRLDFLVQNNVTMFGLWATPIREDWVPLLDAFVNQD